MSTKIDGYEIDKLLENVYSEKKKRSKNILKKPILKSHNRKTIVTNYMDICKVIKKDKNELKKYIDKTLRSKSSIDSNGNLIFSGIITVKQFTNIYLDYVKYYVICKSCKSMNTNIILEKRIKYMKCEDCNIMNGIN